MYYILAIILGGAIITVVYETYYEKKSEKIDSLLAPKLERLIELSSMEISKMQKRQNRMLTEDEKDKILDKCYNEI